MNKNFSLYLDFMRFMAAFVVFLSHFAYPRFTDGDYIIIRDYNLGSDAVVFFFVLSGLVISYTADTKDKNLKQYSFHRFTRLYSVVIPALFITLLLDCLGKHISPLSYQGWWYHDAPLWQKILEGVTLAPQWFGQNFRIGSNGPYWSLSYEAAYYILFGIAYYITNNKKYLFLFLAIFIFGLPIMLLFPIWLLGIWVYKQIKNQTLESKYAWVCALAPPIIYFIFLSIGLPKMLLGLTAYILGVDFVGETLGFSNEFIWNLIIAQLIVFHLLGVEALSRKPLFLNEKLLKFIRWMAGATFTLYIIHYPALQFLDTVLPEDIMMRHGILFFTVIIFCFLFAEISERRLNWFRKILK